MKLHIVIIIVACLTVSGSFEDKISDETNSLEEAENEANETRKIEVDSGSGSEEDDYETKVTPTTKGPADLISTPPTRSADQQGSSNSTTPGEQEPFQSTAADQRNTPQTIVVPIIPPEESKPDQSTSIEEASPEPSAVSVSLETSTAESVSTEHSDGQSQPTNSHVAKKAGVEDVKDNESSHANVSSEYPSMNNTNEANVEGVVTERVVNVFNSTLISDEQTTDDLTESTSESLTITDIPTVPSTEPQGISSEHPITEAPTTNADSANVIDDGEVKPGVDAIESRNITRLDFQKGASVACRDESACKQNNTKLQCEGRLCSETSVQMITCDRAGNLTFSGEQAIRFSLPYRWACGLNDLATEFFVSKSRVVCEGYSYPGDHWILQGSCALVFSLDRLNKSALHGETIESNASFLAIMLTLVCLFGLAFLIIKAVLTKQRHGHWMPSYCALPLKAGMDFRRRRHNDVDSEEPVNVHFDMGEEQTHIGRHRIKTYGAQ